MEQENLPNKSHFKVNEVCSLTGVKPYVLRFWETEFEQIKPIVSASGHKVYDRDDVKKVQQIKKLLFQDKMTIEQAKHALVAPLLEKVPELPQTPDLFSTVAMEEAKDSIWLKKQQFSMAKQKLHSLIEMTSQA